MVLNTMLATILGNVGGTGSESAVEPTVAFRMELNGFEVVTDGTGTTGRCSSYHGKDMDDDVMFALPEFSDERIRFSGRLIPAAGSRFDEGVIGVRVEGDVLVVAVAAEVGAEEWGKGDSGNPIGQGDLFVTVSQGEDLNQYALLNEMNPGRNLGNQGRWRRARAFRDAGDLVGQAVLLFAEDQILTSGGNQGHARGANSPRGLDERIFACGGEPTGVGSVEHYSFDAIQPLQGRELVRWQVSEWTIPLAILGDEEEAMELAFHIAPSCGNDQIGGKVRVPSKEERQRPPKPKKKIS